jgi:hypothetical protein
MRGSKGNVWACWKHASTPNQSIFLFSTIWEPINNNEERNVTDETYQKKLSIEIFIYQHQFLNRNRLFHSSESQIRLNPPNSEIFHQSTMIFNQITFNFTFEIHNKLYFWTSDVTIENSQMIHYFTKQNHSWWTLTKIESKWKRKLGKSH